MILPKNTNYGDVYFNCACFAAMCNSLMLGRAAS